MDIYIVLLIKIIHIEIFKCLYYRYLLSCHAEYSNGPVYFKCAFYIILPNLFFK